MKRSEFVFDYAQVLYYKCHKTNPNPNRIGSPDRIKKQKSNNKSFNKKDNKCFQYAVTVALNYEEIKKGLQRITKIRPFIDKYNCEGINFLSEKYDWKKYQGNNVLNVLYAKKEKMHLANVSKQLKS